MTGLRLVPVALSSLKRSSLGPVMVRSWGRTPPPLEKGSSRRRVKKPRATRSCAVRARPGHLVDGQGRLAVLDQDAAAAPLGQGTRRVAIARLGLAGRVLGQLDTDGVVGVTRQQLLRAGT